MPNTTPLAILAALEAVIEGLTPEGAAAKLQRTVYAEVNEVKYNGDPEALDGSDIDRHFALSEIMPENLDIEGLTTTNVHTGTFVVSIGHQVGDWTATRDRMDKDVHQIIAQLIKVANKPSGVDRIWFEDTERRLIKDNNFWWTDIIMNIQYRVDANYGG